MAKPSLFTGNSSSAYRRRVVFTAAVVAALAMAATVAAVASVHTESKGRDEPNGSPTTAAIFTSATCEHEAALITAALDSDWIPSDIDGDGASDRVATATDDEAREQCRSFVGVRIADGTTYSTVLDAPGVSPPGLPAQVIGLPDLGADGHAEIVVDTHLMVDGALAQLFTLTNDGLERVHVPAFEDGNFVVEGGGVMSPRGAACTADGSFVLSMALLEGARYEVTRHVYPVLTDPLRLTGPQMSADVIPADTLAEQFPEFAAPHFAACGGEVGSGS